MSQQPTRPAPKKRRIGADVPEPLYMAVHETAERLSLSADQLVEHAVKRYLEGIRVVWWKDMIEINLPE